MTIRTGNRIRRDRTYTLHKRLLTCCGMNTPEAGVPGEFFALGPPAWNASETLACDFQIVRGVCAGVPDAEYRVGGRPPCRWWLQGGRLLPPRCDSGPEGRCASGRRDPDQSVPSMIGPSAVLSEPRRPPGCRAMFPRYHAIGPERKTSLHARCGHAFLTRRDTQGNRASGFETGT